MTRLNVNDTRCSRQRFSDRTPRPPEAVAEVISRTVRQSGIGGCVSRMAQESGDLYCFKTCAGPVTCRFGKLS